jgi:hypothetical protein
MVNSLALRLLALQPTAHRLVSVFTPLSSSVALSHLLPTV